MNTLTTLTLAMFITVAQGQYIKFIRQPPNPDACLTPATGLTAARRAELQAQSTCKDAFAADVDGRCYYLCLGKQLKYINADDSINIDEMHIQLPWLTRAFIEASLSHCQDQVNPAEVCGQYAVYKCMMSDIGLYPQGIKYIPFWGLNSDHIQECQQMLEISDEFLCKLLTDTTANHFETGATEDVANARCLYSCLININFGSALSVVKRFNYIERTIVNDVYNKCLVDNSRPPAGCQFDYNMYKCMKLAFKENIPTA